MNFEISKPSLIRMEQNWTLRNHGDDSREQCKDRRRRRQIPYIFQQQPDSFRQISMCTISAKDPNYSQQHPDTLKCTKFII